MDMKNLADKLKLLVSSKLEVVEVDYAALCAQPKDHIAHIMSHRKTAFLIKEVLNKTEVQQLKQDLLALSEDHFELPHPGARTFPPACSTGQLDEASVERFFGRSSHLNEQLKQHLSLDLPQRFANLLQKLNNDVRPQLATRRQDSAPYVHGTVRFIEPNTNAMGLTAPHTGWDYAHRNIKWSYAPLAEYADVYKQISVFMVVQRPDIGGDFTLFNRSREQYHNVKGLTVEDKNSGQRVELFGSNAAYRTLTIEEGDALLFADFDRWHMVEPVVGTRPRISYGCWAAFDKHKGQLYYWS